MIVNYTKTGWQIVMQQAHGLLAAQLYAHWNGEKQPSRWVETLLAIAEHDDHYNEFNQTGLINDHGGPVNFKTTRFKETEMQRLLDNAEAKSAYVTLLLSRHIQFVHGEDPKAKHFIQGLRKREQHWMKIAQSKDAEVTRGYSVLQFCDAFSLLLCQNLVQPEARSIEICKNHEGQAFQLHAEGDLLIVEPWPFESECFKVFFESRTLSQLSFENNSIFQEALKSTTAVSHSITICKRKQH